ncbi:Transposase zinc-ribbon domain-containing protein [Desulforhopalus singaporensis]|uniref:Transposase zinc-ribbon domain-containing protein n=1 Tax=Desulforhopalus singaporensis TaxID=91360 RepID=A0A1H0VQD9_9BACT|nr:Transposase zinc-ribbon domain-containing protein [Desulforhopalus singaporensis]
MPRSKIQFQKGLSLREFVKKYGTEEQCRGLLFKARWPDGYRCPKCSHEQYYYVQIRRVFQCHQCRHQHSIITNTIFTSSKLPLTVWFLAIFSIT